MMDGRVEAGFPVGEVIGIRPGAVFLTEKPREPSRAAGNTGNPL
jgi:hypothetical protein